jgi:hypothetical protein
MAFLDSAIKVDEIEETTPDFQPLPPGWYDAQIVNSEIKTTKAGTGKYIQLQIEILGPTHSGRMIWDRLNFDNPSATAVSIAKAAIKALCKATNVAELSDTEQLHGKPFSCKLAIRPAQGEWEASNDVKAYAGSAKSINPNAESKPGWAG